MDPLVTTPLNIDGENEEVQIEVVDDVPEGGDEKPAAESKPHVEKNVNDADDSELEEYGEKVQKRIKKMSQNYHEERRSKEAALQDKAEAIAYAQRIIARNKQLEAQLAEGSKVYIEKSQSEAALALAAARRAYQEAFENGDSEKAAAAQEQIARAIVAENTAKELKPLTREEEPSYTPSQQSNYDIPEPSDRGKNWLQSNPWFDLNSPKLDVRMRNVALGLDSRIEAEGEVEIDSPEYYELIDAQMKQIFPGYFGTQSQNNREGKPQTRAKPPTVVASANRSTGVTKVKLSQRQIDTAKMLGVSVEEYAKQLHLLEQRGA